MRTAFLLLAIWLILYGLNALFSFGIDGLSIIMGLLALAAGLLLVIGDRPARRRR